MRSLGLRFAGAGQNELIHVVDPFVDYRRSFTADLEKSIRSRGLSTNLDSVKHNYEKWWSSFVKYKKDPSRENKLLMRDNWPHLQAVLNLPSEVYNLDDIAQAVNEEKYNNNGNEVDSVDYLSSKLIKTIPGSVRASAPHLVRSAVLEGCHIPLDQHPLIDGHDNASHLTGVSLPSLVSLLVDKDLNKKNTWPLALVSHGQTYNRTRNGLKESKVIVLFNVSPSDMDVKASFLQLTQSINSVIGTQSSRVQSIAPSNLSPNEAGALSLISGAGGYRARISLIDTFISRRLNILSQGLFVRLNFAVINCSRSANPQK